MQDPEDRRKNLLGERSYAAVMREQHCPQSERVMTVTQNVHGKGKEAALSSESMDFLSRK